MHNRRRNINEMEQKTKEEKEKESEKTQKPKIGALTTPRFCMYTIIRVYTEIIKLDRVARYHCYF